MSSSSYSQLLRSAAATLQQADTDSAQIDAQALLQHVSGKSLAWLLAHGDDIATETEREQFLRTVARRAANEPIAYIVGSKEFWSLELSVTPDVLVPRPDTETLVEQALARIPKDASFRIADLGTGSGAIALAIAKERPLSTVLAVDFSENALALAQKNAQTHQLNNLEFVHSDWYSALDSRAFDVILSNPPYVEAGDPHLEMGDLPNEPDLALIGKDDGLGDIRIIVSQAHAFLRQSKVVIIEHGSDQGEQVRNIFLQHGFVDIATHRDLNQLERCTSARL